LLACSEAVSLLAAHDVHQLPGTPSMIPADTTFKFGL